MKILHISSDPLPDARVEKAASSSRKLGHEIYFAGPGVEGFHLATNPFAGSFTVSWERKSRMGFEPAWRSVRGQLAQAIKETRPDVVHAHNIFSAELAHEMNLPMVYDDHEYWSMIRKAELEGWAGDSVRHPARLPRNLIRRYGEWLWKRWESRVIPDVPIITVSEEIARAHGQRGARNVFVVPNLPSQEEIEKVAPPTRRDYPLSAVSIGKDFTTPMRIRDSRFLLQIFSSAPWGQLTVIGDPELDSRVNVRSVKSMVHLEMLRELSNHHVGIIGWAPHWFHRFCNPNKAFEYMHAGLIPIIPSTLTTVLQMSQGFAKTFSNYEELTQILHTLSMDLEQVNKSRAEIFKFSKDTLLWEQYERRILEAYAKVS